MTDNIGCAESVRMTETYRKAHEDVKETLLAVARTGIVGSLRVREIICRCPPGWKYCDCEDLAINKRNQ